MDDAIPSNISLAIETIPSELKFPSEILFQKSIASTHFFNAAIQALYNVWLDATPRRTASTTMLVLW
jgi:hypothetical protein